MWKNPFWYNLDKNPGEIFTGFCKEQNHPCNLEFYCKNHNKLCCAKCITKLKSNEIGQHTDCDVYFIKNIKDEKKNKLKENIKYLEDISLSLDQSIKDLKILYENINKNKEELKLKIQKIFTNIRNAINEREDELLLDIDKNFNQYYFNEELFKKSEKLPKFVKDSLEKGKKINGPWKEDTLNSYIDVCINIEDNINEIKKINEIVKKSNDQNINIKFISEENDIKNIFKSIKELGKIIYNEKLFDSKIEFDQELVKEWLNNKKFVSELLFRKSKDGDKPKDFHNKCDNKGITIIFIETTKGYKFGAYTELNWKSGGLTQKDNSTFLFSFDNKKKYEAKINNGSIGSNDCNDIWYGSNFPEIYFDKTLNKGRTYDHNSFSTFLIKKTLTKGEEYWDVKEIDVFKIIYI